MILQNKNHRIRREPFFFIIISSKWFRHSLFKDFKLEKGPTDKAKEPDPGGSDQQNLGFKKLKNRKTDCTVGLNFSVPDEILEIQKFNPTVRLVFLLLVIC